LVFLWTIQFPFSANMGLLTLPLRLGIAHRALVPVGSLPFPECVRIFEQDAPTLHPRFSVDIALPGVRAPRLV
jgi:hypothetical protein